MVGQEFDFCCSVIQDGWTLNQQDGSDDGEDDEFLCPPNHYSEEGCTRCANNRQALYDHIIDYCGS